MNLPYKWYNKFHINFRKNGKIKMYENISTKFLFSNIKRLMDRWLSCESRCESSSQLSWYCSVKRDKNLIKKSEKINKSNHESLFPRIYNIDYM